MESENRRNGCKKDWIDAKAMNERNMRMVASQAHNAMAPPLSSGPGTGW